MVLLQGKHIKLRALEPEDLQYIYKWENNSAIWRVSETTSPYSKFVIKQYLANIDKDIYEAKQLRLMIDVYDQEVWQATVGTVDLFDFDPFNNRAGIGIMLEEHHQGKGIAAETLELLIQYCFDFLHLKQLYCHIPADNAPSLKLFRNCGFQEAGLLKNWLRSVDGYVDEYVMQLISSK